MFKKLKTYNEITGYAQIARRYFVNNFYDGMLTILGILLGFFVFLLQNPNQPIPSSYVILTGLGTSISMLISGVSGSYLSEKAEQKKGKKELDRAMGILNNEKETLGEIAEEDEKEIEKAMVIPINNSIQEKKRKLKRRKREKREKLKRIRTLHEKAERFTGIIVSIVNGVSPFLGGVVAIIPFFLVEEAGLNCFITSFVIIFVCIIFLGTFLGIISEESIPKNIIQMVAAFTITIIITILILGA
jgi:predicted membrane protein (TIGR00267 family)